MTYIYRIFWHYTHIKALKWRNCQLCDYFPQLPFYLFSEWRKHFIQQKNLQCPRFYFTNLRPSVSKYVLRQFLWLYPESTSEDYIASLDTIIPCYLYFNSIIIIFPSPGIQTRPYFFLKCHHHLSLKTYIPSAMYPSPIFNILAFLGRATCTFLHSYSMESKTKSLSVGIKQIRWNLDSHSAI